MSDIYNTWWSEVSGPSRFIDAIADVAAFQKSTIISLPESVPFEDELYLILRSRLENELAGQDAIIIDGISGSVSDYFLNVYCKKELRTSFRPKPDYSAAKFLAEAQTTTMHGKIYIVKIKDETEFMEWISFVSDYMSSSSRKITPAVFILAVKNVPSAKAVKGLKYFDFRGYISKFDAYAYTVIRAASISEKNRLFCTLGG